MRDGETDQWDPRAVEVLSTDVVSSELLLNEPCRTAYGFHLARIYPVFKAVVVPTSNPCSVALHITPPHGLPEAGYIDRPGTMVAWAIMAILEKHIPAIKELPSRNYFQANMEAQSYMASLFFQSDDAELFCPELMHAKCEELCGEINTLAPQLNRALLDPDQVSIEAYKASIDERTRWRRIIESASVLSDILRTTDALRATAKLATHPQQLPTRSDPNATNVTEATMIEESTFKTMETESPKPAEVLEASDSPSPTHPAALVEIPETKKMPELSSDSGEQSTSAACGDQEPRAAQKEPEPTPLRTTETNGSNYRSKCLYTEATKRLTHTSKEAQYEVLKIDLADLILPGLFLQKQSGQPIVHFSRSKLAIDCQGKQPAIAIGRFQKQQIEVFEVLKLTDKADNEEGNPTLFGSETKDT